MCLFQKHLVKVEQTRLPYHRPLHRQGLWNTFPTQAFSADAPHSLQCSCGEQGVAHSESPTWSINSLKKKEKSTLYCFYPVQPMHAYTLEYSSLYIELTTLLWRTDMWLLWALFVLWSFSIGESQIYGWDHHTLIKGKLCLCPTRPAAFQLKWQLTSDWLKPATLLAWQKEKKKKECMTVLDIFHEKHSGMLAVKYLWKPASRILTLGAWTWAEHYILVHISLLQLHHSWSFHLNM